MNHNKKHKKTHNGLHINKCTAKSKCFTTKLALSLPLIKNMWHFFCTRWLFFARFFVPPFFHWHLGIRFFSVHTRKTQKDSKNETNEWIFLVFFSYSVLQSEEIKREKKQIRQFNCSHQCFCFQLVGVLFVTIIEAWNAFHLFFSFTLLAFIWNRGKM